MPDITLRLASVIERLPIAIALVSSTGHFRGKAGGMAGLLGDIIPSHDDNEATRWSFTDARGSAIPRKLWPSARALRGERIYSGLVGSFHDETRHTIKVISVPTPGAASSAAAVTFVQVLDTHARSAAGSHQDLQQRLIDELARAVSTGWDAHTHLMAS